jgi:hypothetical protein
MTMAVRRRWVATTRSIRRSTARLGDAAARVLMHRHMWWTGRPPLPKRTVGSRSGRYPVASAAALVTSAVLGGVLAAAFSARVTYFATVPLVGEAAVEHMGVDAEPARAGRRR